MDSKTFISDSSPVRVVVLILILVCIAFLLKLSSNDNAVKNKDRLKQKEYVEKKQSPAKNEIQEVEQKPKLPLENQLSVYHYGKEQEPKKEVKPFVKTATPEIMEECRKMVDEIIRESFIGLDDACRRDLYSAKFFDKTNEEYKKQMGWMNYRVSVAQERVRTLLEEYNRLLKEYNFSETEEGVMFQNEQAERFEQTDRQMRNRLRECQKQCDEIKRKIIDEAINKK